MSNVSMPAEAALPMGTKDALGICWEGPVLEKDVRVAPPERGPEIKYVWVENPKG